MSPIVQSGDRPCFVTHQTEPSALGKSTIATGNLSSHATEPNVGLPQKLAKKNRASALCAAPADELNCLNLSSRQALFYYPLASSFSIASITSLSSGFT